MLFLLKNVVVPLIKKKLTLLYSGQSYFARSHCAFDLETGIIMQAILKQLGKETDIFDDDELQGYQKLQNLYNSTRETKVCHEVLFYYVDSFTCL